MQVEGPDILPDDVVRVIDDMAELHRLQSGSKGWDDDMALVSYVALSLPACLHPNTFQTQSLCVSLTLLRV